MKVNVDFDLCTSNAVCMGIDSTQTLTLADLTINGQPRKVIMQANKNGFLYVIDENPGPEFDERLRQAVQGCPNGAISIEE